MSTQSIDGKTENLLPISYFQIVDHDPPMFIVGFSARAGRPKDTCCNRKETGECVINVVSENMMPVVKAISVDAVTEATRFKVRMPSTTICLRLISAF